jgi:hypothetical protein
MNFYNQHRPEGTEAGELLLRRRRANLNHLCHYGSKVGGNHCKYDIREAFATDSTPYLWILKPTFYNRVGIS